MAGAVSIRSVSGPRPGPDAAGDSLERLTRNAADVIPRDELAAKLARSRGEGRPLRVKLGIDPSRPDLHLGHAVVLRKLREFQALGHTAVLIVGDFTGLVGDPSGQSETRPMLTPEEMEANARTYLDQAGLVLDVERAEIRRNSEWLGALSMAEVLRLTSQYTVARMLERDDFAVRHRERKPISVVEFLYPLMQAYDSVAVEADVEMGGTDQTFNLLVGRDIQRAYGQEPQVVFTMPLLEGTDGARKMSKSFDNYVALTDPPEEMFGKLMSIPDDLMPRYFELCTSSAFDPAGHPNAEKRRLAREIVTEFHGAGAAQAAEDRFVAVHRRHEAPPGVAEVELPASLADAETIWLPRLLVEVGLVASNAEGRRQLEQGAVRLDGRPVGPDAGAEIPREDLLGRVLQVGRRRFVRIAGDRTRVR